MYSSILHGSCDWIDIFAFDSTNGSCEAPQDSVHQQIKFAKTLFPLLFSGKAANYLGYTGKTREASRKWTSKRQGGLRPRLLGRAAAWAAQLWNEEHLHTLVRGVQRFIICAVLARGTVFGGYAPFGLAMAAALMARGAGLSALGGMICGVMLLGEGLKSGVYVAAALLVLCVMSVCAGLRVVTARWFAPTVATLAGTACTFVFLPVGPALGAADVLTFAAVQGLTFGACRVYGAALAPPAPMRTTGGGLRPCWS